MPASDSYIFWCAPSVNEEDDDVGFEDSMPGEEELTDTKTNEKGKGRESMYVSLVEGNFFQSLNVMCMIHF